MDSAVAEGKGPGDAGGAAPSKPHGTKRPPSEVVGEADSERGEGADGEGIPAAKKFRPDVANGDAGAAVKREESTSPQFTLTAAEEAAQKQALLAFSAARTGRKAAAAANTKLLEKSIKRETGKSQPGSAKRSRPKVKDGSLPQVGNDLQVHWDENGKWYLATVVAHNAETGKHTLRYKDGGETEEVDLSATTGEKVTWRKVAPYALPSVLPEKSRAGRKGKKHKVGVVPPAVQPKLKQAIEILWPDDGEWYEATVVNFSPELVQHGLLYQKGETEWVDLQPSARERVTWRVSQKVHEPATPAGAKSAAKAMESGGLSRVKAESREASESEGPSLPPSAAASSEDEEEQAPPPKPTPRAKPARAKPTPSEAKAKAKEKEKEKEKEKKPVPAEKEKEKKPVPARQESTEKPEQQWVQCERRKCGKWRKVPAHINPESLPDKWTCSQNYWDDA